jgi:hypothetical protein
MPIGAHHLTVHIRARRLGISAREMEKRSRSQVAIHTCTGSTLPDPVGSFVQRHQAGQQPTAFFNRFVTCGVTIHSFELEGRVWSHHKLSNIHFTLLRHAGVGVLNHITVKRQTTIGTYSPENGLPKRPPWCCIERSCALTDKTLLSNSYAKNKRRRKKNPIVGLMGTRLSLRVCAELGVLGLLFPHAVDNMAGKLVRGTTPDQGP